MQLQPFVHIADQSYEGNNKLLKAKFSNIRFSYMYITWLINPSSWRCFWSQCCFCLIADTKPFPLQDDNLVSPISSKCLRDRQQALTNALSKDLIMLGVFVPKCEVDGSYRQVQCLNTSRYCWCVDSDGKEIQGTRVRLRQPNCPTVARSEFLVFWSKRLKVTCMYIAIPIFTNREIAFVQKYKGYIFPNVFAKRQN